MTRIWDSIPGVVTGTRIQCLSLCKYAVCSYTAVSWSASLETKGSTEDDVLLSGHNEDRTRVSVSRRDQSTGGGFSNSEGTSLLIVLMDESRIIVDCWRTVEEKILNA